MRTFLISVFVLLLTYGTSAQNRKISIDKSITGFVNEFQDGDMVNYTLKPVESYGLEEVYSSIAIMFMPDDMSEEEAIKSVEEEMEKGRMQGDQFNDYKKEGITFNGYKATTLSVTAIEAGSETKVYMAFVEGNGQKVVFVGEDTDGGKHYDKIKATLKTLKIN